MTYKRKTNKAFAAQLEAAGYFSKIGIAIDRPRHRHNAVIMQGDLINGRPVTVTIDEVGDIKMLDTEGSEKFLDIGEVTTRRASHVYPVNCVKRAAFRLLRTAFGDKGLVSDWTRGWSGYWIVDTAPTAGIVLDATYASHADAVAGEIKFLNDYFLGRQQ